MTEIFFPKNALQRNAIKSSINIKISRNKVWLLNVFLISLGSGSSRPSKISPIFQAHLEFDLRDAQIFSGFNSSWRANCSKIYAWQQLQRPSIISWISSLPFSPRQGSPPATVHPQNFSKSWDIIRAIFVSAFARLRLAEAPRVKLRNTAVWVRRVGFLWIWFRLGTRAASK